MALFLIGIDDTDNDTSPGTGQLARHLAREIESRGATVNGITRHQFLVDPRIPYTSHNSGACLTVDWPGQIEGLQFAFDLIQQWSAEGSDPGVCVAPADQIPRAIIDCAWRATREVLAMSDVLALAKAQRLWLEPLGGTGQGIIGALSSVGLRADGNEGRFLELAGLRDLAELVSRDDLTQIGITIDHVEPADSATKHPATQPVYPPIDQNPAQPLYRTFNWVRPRLRGGRAVWPVQWSDEHQSWIGVDQKRSRPLE